VPARRAGGRRVARGTGLGILAALAFGAFLLGLGESGEAAGAGAVLVGRAASVAVLALAVAVVRPGLGATAADRATIGVVAGLGSLDAAANLAFAGAAATGGAGVVVAVIGSLYPVTTVVLARVLLAERLGRLRATGVGAVLGGVALLSASAP
jgi:drug/metabolite transporter (DMT)-like permease